jgi:hypothetical protein
MNESMVGVPARLRQLVSLMDLLTYLAEETAKAGRKAVKASARRGRGATLRPGPETPLWNEVVAAANAQVQRRGDKARLARVLGVPRQRVDQYLRAKSALPDAERTLRLLTWVQARRSGRDIL